jgi:hypothetical protein
MCRIALFASVALWFLAASCASGYEATARPAGIEASELACARRIYVGENTHLGMPHWPRNEEIVARVVRTMRRDIPEVILVKRPEDADFVISVLLVPAIACSHCEPGPDVEWSAIVEYGGPRHRNDYGSVGAFLELHGRVAEGVSAAWGVVKQLRELIHFHTCTFAT